MEEQQPDRSTWSDRSIPRALSVTRPWLMAVSLVWLAIYGFGGIILLWVMATIRDQDHPAAKALAVLLAFFLLFLAVAMASAALLLRAALTLRNMPEQPSTDSVIEALRQIGHYWTFSGLFWVVFLIGSVVAFFAAGVGAVLL